MTEEFAFNLKNLSELEAKEIMRRAFMHNIHNVNIDDSFRMRLSSCLDSVEIMCDGWKLCVFKCGTAYLEHGYKPAMLNALAVCKYLESLGRMKKVEK